MKALLLSAGKGVRFQPQTLNHSKMVLPFLNTPIIGYPLKLLEDLGVKELIINTHSFPQQLEKEVLKLKPRIQKIHFSFEKNLLGGAGTLKKHHAFFQGEDMIYLNGDSIFFCSDFFSELQKQHRLQKNLITFLVQENNQKIDLWACSEGQITGLKNQKTAQGKSYFFPGFALIHPDCLSLLKNEDSNIFHSLVQNFPQRCRVYVKNDLEFFEVGFLEEYLASTQKCLESLFQKNLKSKHLKEVILRYSPNFDFQTQLKRLNQKDILLTGENVEGLNHVQVKDFAVIGNNCQFKKPTVIERSVLNSNQQIHSSHLFQNLFM